MPTERRVLVKKIRGDPTADSAEQVAVDIIVGNKNDEHNTMSASTSSNGKCKEVCITGTLLPPENCGGDSGNRKQPPEETAAAQGLLIFAAAAGKQAPDLSPATTKLRDDDAKSKEKKSAIMDVGGDDVTVELVSSDGKSFKVDFRHAKLSKLVADIVDGGKKKIYLTLIRSEVLGLIINFFYHHKMEPISIETPLCSIDIYDLVPRWYADFVMNMKPAIFFEMMEAANYMGIQPLIGLTCLVAAILFNRKSANAIRSVFNCNPRVTEDGGDANKGLHKRGGSKG